MDTSTWSTVGGSGGFVLGLAAFISARWDKYRQHRDKVDELAQAENDKREADAVHQPDAAVARLEIVNSRMDTEITRLTAENDRLRIEADKVGALTNEVNGLRDENARAKAWSQQSIEDRDMIIKQNRDMKTALELVRAQLDQLKRPRK